MTIQGTSFSPWTSWTNRNSLPDKDEPGVYLIARFEQQPPSGPANPFEKSVVYIGESSEGRLRTRWRSFERSAFRDKGKHRGGKRYKERFGGDSSVLYVSTLSDNRLVRAFLEWETSPLLDINKRSAKVDVTDKLLSEIDDLLVKYMERRLILLYSLVHGHRPVCNAD